MIDGINQLPDSIACHPHATTFRWCHEGIVQCFLSPRPRCIASCLQSSVSRDKSFKEISRMATVNKVYLLKYTFVTLPFVTLPLQMAISSKKVWLTYRVLHLRSLWKSAGHPVGWPTRNLIGSRAKTIINGQNEAVARSGTQGARDHGFWCSSWLPTLWRTKIGIDMNMELGWIGCGNGGCYARHDHHDHHDHQKWGGLRPQTSKLVLATRVKVPFWNLLPIWFSMLQDKS